MKLYVKRRRRDTAVDRLSIGNKIKELRMKAGFNQSITAEYLQVDQSLISKIEK